MCAMVWRVSSHTQVLPPGASKGSGLSWLLNHLNIDPCHVMALGDGENDVEMLQLAGVSERAFLCMQVTHVCTI